MNKQIHIVAIHTKKYLVERLAHVLNMCDAVIDRKPNDVLIARKYTYFVAMPTETNNEADPKMASVREMIESLSLNRIEPHSDLKCYHDKMKMPRYGNLPSPDANHHLA